MFSRVSVRLWNKLPTKALGAIVLNSLEDEDSYIDLETLIPTVK